MGSKRARLVKKEGYISFAPDAIPTYVYGGKILTGGYDRECWLAGWRKAQSEHESERRRREEEEYFWTFSEPHHPEDFE